MTLTLGPRGQELPAAALKRFRAGLRQLERPGTPAGDWWGERVTASVWSVEDETRAGAGHHVHAHALVSSRARLWYSVGAWRRYHGRRAEDDSAGRPDDLTLREAWAQALGYTKRSAGAARRAARLAATARAAAKRAARAEASADPDAARLAERAAEAERTAERAAAEAHALAKLVAELQVNVRPVRDANAALREALKYVLKGASAKSIQDSWRLVGELACDVAGRRLIRTTGRWYGLDGDPPPRADGPPQVLVTGTQLLDYSRGPDAPRAAWARLALATLAQKYREAWRRRKAKAERRQARRLAREARKAGARPPPD
ncbi:MAG: hypothetical protein AB7I35_21625 [Ramlibacter sp.]